MLSFIKGNIKRLRKRGQATIEYVMMLCTVVVVLTAALTTFHNDIARWFFTLIGMILDQRPTA